MAAAVRRDDAHLAATRCAGGHAWWGDRLGAVNGVPLQSECRPIAHLLRHGHTRRGATARQRDGVLLAAVAAARARRAARRRLRAGCWWAGGAYAARRALPETLGDERIPVSRGLCALGSCCCCGDSDCGAPGCARCSSYPRGAAAALVGDAVVRDLPLALAGDHGHSTRP